LLLTIEKLIYGGDGLARLPEDSAGRRRAVFVPFTIGGETVEVDLTPQAGSFARAHLKSVVEPSSERTHPECPYFGHCGGCQYQHIRYEHQLATKADILRENLQRIAKIELKEEIQLHPSPPWQYRNRTRLAVRPGAEFVLGYRRPHSQSVLPVESCPISSPLIQQAIAALLHAGREHQIPEAASEIEIFANDNDTALMLVLYVQKDRGLQDTAWQRFTTAIQSTLPQVETAALLAERDLEKLASGAPTPAPQVLFGSGSLTYKCGAHSYRVSAGSFFQSNRQMLDKLINLVTGGQSGVAALDLYAGAGLFTLPLAAYFRRVFAVEASPLSHSDLRYNLPANGKAVRSTAEDYLDGDARKLRADLVVVDPPRTGLGSRAARSLARLEAPRIVYVSCDPATLARDLGPLFAAGYRVEQAHVVDLFPQTYHLETVLHLKR
jgi:23S rRNA (uracil1939-C5)-methyltransferase